MSAINISGELIHYEVLGRGRPVVLIHSWLGSWRYWVPTMQNLQLKYRVYALDLHGFGDTSKNPQKYSLDNQVRLLLDFMQAMAIPKAAIIGHGLGAWLTAEFGRLYPDMAPRVMLISAPLYEIPNLDKRARPGRVSPLTNNRAAPETTIMNSTMRTALAERMRAAGSASLLETTELRAASGDSTRYNPLNNVIGSATPESLLQRCFKRSDPLYSKMELDLPKTDARVLRASANEFDAGRVLDAVWLLQMPTVVVHGQDDKIIEKPGERVWDYTTFEKEDKLIPVELPDVGHFPMLEFDRFNRLVNEFLEIDDIARFTPPGVRWKRQYR